MLPIFDLQNDLKRRPSSFSFVCILQAKGVSDVIVCAHSLYFEMCCCSRWGFV
jgi:hypothetical protein